MYCILFCFVLITIHKPCSSIRHKETISILEEYLQRRGESRTNFDYSFNEALPSDKEANQGRPVAPDDSYDRPTENHLRESPTEKNGDPGGELPRYAAGDINVEGRDEPVEPETQKKEIEEIVDDPEPAILPVDAELDRPELSWSDLIHNKAEIKTHDKPEFEIIDKIKSRVHDRPEMYIHDKDWSQSTEISTIKMRNISELHIPTSRPQIRTNNRIYLKKNNQSNDVNKYPKEILRDNSMKKPKANIKHDKYNENSDTDRETTITTKKSHTIPKPTVPLFKPEEIFQKAFENDLKNDLNDKTEPRYNKKPIQRKKTTIKRKKDTDDESELINFKDIYTSSDHDKEDVQKKILKKQVQPIKDQPVSEEKILVSFKDIYQPESVKKVAKKSEDKIKNDERTPLFTEYDEEDDGLKNYYNRGKLITAQTVKDVINNKGLQITSEYSIDGRRNFDESLPESIEPDTGELVGKDTKIADYNPADGTIDGMGPVKIDKNVTNNGTQNKKQHHHHHHHQQKQHKNNKNKKTTQQTKHRRRSTIGFPGKILDAKGPFLYDDFDDSSKELEIINEERRDGYGAQDAPGDLMGGMPNGNDMPGPMGGPMGGPGSVMEGSIGGLGSQMGFRSDSMGGPIRGPERSIVRSDGSMGGPMFMSNGPMGRPMYGPGDPMGRPNAQMGGPGSMYGPMTGPGGPIGERVEGPGVPIGRPVDSMGRPPSPMMPRNPMVLPENYMDRDGSVGHIPNINENGAMAPFPTGNLDSEDDYSQAWGKKIGLQSGQSGALRNRPEDYMAGSGGPMGGPGGPMGGLQGYMGGPGSDIGEPGGSMGGPGGPMGGPGGFMGGPGGPMGGPGGPMGGPGGPMGGPGGPMGGPGGPIGGPGGPMRGPIDPMGGPGGPMGRPGGPMGPRDYMGGPDSPMGGPGSPMGGPNGPMGGFQDYKEGRSGSMGDSGGPMGGPGGPMGPQDYMGGPDSPMGGPRSPMGGPDGPMGGFQDYKEGPDGSMGGSGGSMGGPGSPMGGLQSYMGGSGSDMGDPGGSMGGPGGPMGGPGGFMRGPGGYVGGPGGPMGGPGGPMGDPGGFMGSPSDPMGVPGGPMGDPGGPMRGPGGPMGGSGGSMGIPGGPMGRPGGPVEGSGGPMGGLRGPMGRPGGPMGEPGGLMGGPSGPIEGRDSLVDPDYYGFGGPNAHLLKPSNQAEMATNYQAKLYYGQPAQGPQRQYGPYKQGGPSNGPGSFGQQFGGGFGSFGPAVNFGQLAQTVPTTVYTQRPPDLGGPFDPDSGGPLGVDGDPVYAKKVKEGEINITTIHHNHLGMYIYLNNSPSVPSNRYPSRAPGMPVNDSGRQGFDFLPPNSPKLMNKSYPPNMPTNKGYFGMPNKNMVDNNGFQVYASTQRDNGPFLPGGMGGNPPRVLYTQSYSVYTQDLNELQGRPKILGILPDMPGNNGNPNEQGDRSPINYPYPDPPNNPDNPFPPKQSGPPIPEYLVQTYITKNPDEGSPSYGFSKQKVGPTVQFPVPGGSSPSPKYILNKDAENRTDDTQATGQVTTNIPNVTLEATTSSTSQSPKAIIITEGQTESTTSQQPDTTTFNPYKPTLPIPPSMKYDSKGRPMTSPKYLPDYEQHVLFTTKTVPTTTTIDPLHVSIDIFPEPPPSPAPVITVVTETEKTIVSKYPFHDDFMQQAIKLKVGVATMFLTKLAETIAMMTPADISKLLHEFHIVLRNNAMFLRFYGEPFHEVLLETTEEFTTRPGDENKNLAATVYRALATREKKLSDDLNSVLEFMDKIISTEDQDGFIRLLYDMKAYPKDINAKDLAQRIMYDVFREPMLRMVHTSQWRLFIQGLNTYIALNYRPGQHIVIPDPPEAHRRQGDPSDVKAGVTSNLNYKNANNTSPRKESSKEYNNVTKTLIDNKVNESSENIGNLREKIASNIKRRIMQYRMKPNKSIRMNTDTYQPKLDTPQSVYDTQRESSNGNKNNKFIRRLKEHSFKKNIVAKTNNSNKNNTNNNSYYNNNDNKTSRNDSIQRRQLNPQDLEMMKMELLKDFTMPATEFPHTLLELVINEETTKDSKFRALDMPPELKMDSSKNMPFFDMPSNKQSIPPGFPPDMFKAINQNEKKKNNFNPDIFDADNFNADNFNPNNFNPIKMNPDKPSDLPDELSQLPAHLSFDSLGTITSSTTKSNTFEINTFDIRQRNGEDSRSNENKAPKTTTKKKKKSNKKKGKSESRGTTKKGLKDQIKKYVNYAKDIIKTKVRPVEKRLKKIQKSKDKITTDGKHKKISEEQRKSRENKEIDIKKKRNKIKKSKEKRKKEKESIIEHSREISEIGYGDGDFGYEKLSHEKKHNHHTHKRKKNRKNRKHLRNNKNKYKLRHKHKRLHKKRKHNKHRKRRKHRHKKHHKYRYLVLEGVRRDNVRGRLDLYSVERHKNGNTSQSADDSLDSSNSENGFFNDNWRVKMKNKNNHHDENNDYKTLSTASIFATMLGRNTRFYIVKNVRSTVSTTDQPDINNWPFHKRFNIIRNTKKPYMKIISANISTKNNAINNTATTKSNNTEFSTNEYSSGESKSSTESDDGLPIDKFVPSQKNTPKRAKKRLVTSADKQNTTILLKHSKRKNFSIKLDPVSLETINDKDYLSKNEEAVFSDWLKTVDRVKFTPSLQNRKLYSKIKSTLSYKPKYTTNNVTHIIFFKGSDEYDKKEIVRRAVVDLPSTEEDTSLRCNKRTNNGDDYIQSPKSLRKPFRNLNPESSFEISLENKDYINDSDEPAKPYYKSRDIPERPQSVGKASVRKVTKTLQSHEKGLVKFIAKQFQTMEKMNNKFDKKKASNIHSDDVETMKKHNSSKLTTNIDEETQLDLDVWVPEPNYHYDSSETENTFEDSREISQREILKVKQNTTSTTIKATNNIGTTENIRMTTDKIRVMSSTGSKSLYKVTGTVKFKSKDFGYDPTVYDYNTVTPTAERVPFKDIDLEQVKPGNLRQGPTIDDRVEFLSDEESNISNENLFATNVTRRNKLIENWQRSFSSASTLLPKKIRIRILKKLSEITNYNDTLRRQSKRFSKLDVSESSDEERIIKNNIYKYFGDNERMKQEHDELNKTLSLNKSQQRNITGHTDTIEV